MRITPPYADKLHMVRSDKSQLIAVVQMCLNKRGTVAQLRLIKTSGYPGHDAKLLRLMRAWTYRPYEVNGRAVPVCTTVTFVYRQTR